MKRVLFAFLILSSISCGRNEGRHKKDQLTNPEPVALEEIDPSETAVWAEIIHKNADYDYYGFGEIGFEDRKYREDTLSFPPIPGLVHRTAYEYCHRDTCFANYAVLALRCPDSQHLLEWVENCTREYVTDWPICLEDRDYYTNYPPIPKKKLRSAKEICTFYMKWLSKAFKQKECDPWSGTSRLNLECGYLLADCWRKGDLCTFYEGEWTNENNMPHEAFRTVDATTGMELGLSDLVDSTKFDRLATLMMPRIINIHGDRLVDQWTDYPGREIAILKELSGCGLIEEGLIIYFYPYNIGSGADGEQEAIIPYNEVEALLKPEILKSMGISDTVAEYNNLEEAPLVTISDANRWNPSYTGMTTGWEKRLEKMYTDSTRNAVKTLIMKEAFMVSESALSRRNSVDEPSPVLLDAFDEGKKQRRYYDQHTPDSTWQLSFSKTISDYFDCRFGDSERIAIMKSAYPIALNDTSLFRPVITMTDNLTDKVFSPLFECRFRKKGILISAFDIESLCSFPAGEYLWKIIRNYSYTEHLRNEVYNRYKEVDDDQWLNTLLPYF